MYTCTSGRGDSRKYCKPDAVFTKGRKGAIVEMKNYEVTPLDTSQIDKTYKDMRALKDSLGCRQVSEAFLFLSFTGNIEKKLLFINA